MSKLLRFVFSGLGLALVAWLVASAPVHAAPTRVSLCHANDEGGYHLITVSEEALAAHLRHGDGQPGDPVPGMDGFVFDDGCAPAPTTNPDPIAAGCYRSDSGWGDLEYVGPANTAGNVIVWPSTNGTCTGFVLEDRDAIVVAAHETLTAEVCSELGLTLSFAGPLNGPVLNYAGFPPDAWYCNAPSEVLDQMR